MATQTKQLHPSSASPTAPNPETRRSFPNLTIFSQSAEENDVARIPQDGNPSRSSVPPHDPVTGNRQLRRSRSREALHNVFHRDSGPSSMPENGTSGNGQTSITNGMHSGAAATSEAKPMPGWIQKRNTASIDNGSSSAPASDSRPVPTKRVSSFLDKVKSGFQHRSHVSPSKDVASPPERNNLLDASLAKVAAEREAAQSRSSASGSSRRPENATFGSSSFERPPVTPTGSQPSTPASPASPTAVPERTPWEPIGSDEAMQRRRASSATDLSQEPMPGQIVKGVTFGGTTSGDASRPHLGRRYSGERAPENPAVDSQAWLPESERRRFKLPRADTDAKSVASGVGLKARRLSTSLPEDFTVSYCQLHDEFKSASKVPGKRGKSLGKGATATVSLMIRKGGSNDEVYAVKEFRPRDSSDSEAEYVMKVKSEYSIAASLEHPNIVKTIRLCIHNNRWNHVMDYCDKGELYSLIERGLFKTYYQLEARLCFFKQLLRAVDYLHNHGIAHRDIKPENILLTSAGHLKLTDFGVSEVFSGIHPGLRSSGGQCGTKMGEVRLSAPGICGSIPYIAPEVLAKQGPYDPRPLDVWGCAMVFIAMKYGGTAWQKAEPNDKDYGPFKAAWDEWLAGNPDREITDRDFPRCGKAFTLLDNPALKRLMLRMLHPMPEKRISIHDALTQGFMKGVDCCSPEVEDEVGKGVDATKAGKAKAMKVRVKHDHMPPKEHRTPRFLQHRFDMGEGWADGPGYR